MAYVVLLLFIIGAGVLIFRKPKKAIVQPFPAQWQELLLENVNFYRKLNQQRQQEFQQRIMKFLSEVYIEGVQTELTDFDKILIASSAVIPVFGFAEWQYTNLSGVLLYPDHFNHDLEFADGADSRNIGGMVGSGRFENQMILSRRALYHGFDNTTDKGNTGIHEFVHLIDKMDGLVDGIPEALLPHQYAVPWLKLMHKSMEAINDDTSDIRHYGGTSQAEFFAVAAEYFFERPDLLRIKHPELYKMMLACFNPKTHG
ncbi:zinc-dependent peptidase [Flavobacterium sp. RHBU_24]|uniref:M90 family metallopeptidase n=1 Tax=Flavobacterium sp. RHBU_24 TaxID=3391185 RepID=UPI003985017C